MKGLILAAGGGTRLRPLTDARPKPLVPVAGKPVLQYNLENLRDAGITEVVVVINARDTRIAATFGDGEGLGLRLTYVPQEELLGTAHAVQQARPYLEDSSFALTFGDNMTGYSLREMLDDHRAHGGAATLAVFEAGDPRRHAVIAIENGWVSDIEERPEHPKSNLTSAGMFVLGPEIFAAIDRVKPVASGEYYLPHAIQLLVESGVRVGIARVNAWRRNINTPEDLLFATRLIVASEPAPGSGHGAETKGPVRIGEGVRAGRGTVLGPDACVGANCRVGEASRIRNSILFEGAVVGDGCLLDNCILGEGAVVPNGLSIIGHEMPIIIADGCTATGE